MSSLPAHAQSPPAPRKRARVEHSDEMRQRVVDLPTRGDSWAQIVAATGVPRSTAQSIVASADAEGHASKKQRGGNRKAVIPASVRAHVVSAQEHDAALRLRDLADSVQRELHTTPPSLKSLSRILVEEGYTTKRLQQYANDRNTAATKQKRQKWVHDVGRGLRADTAIFIDESPFSFCIMRTRGRSRRGQPALGVVPAIRGKNHTVIAAISPTLGLVHDQIHITQPSEEFSSKRKGSKKKKTGPKGVTRDIFRGFIVDLLAKLAAAAPGRRFTLLYDNARIHKGDISDVIFSSGHAAQALAPWSPELNPIEYAFSTWKFAYTACTIRPQKRRWMLQFERAQLPSLLLSASMTSITLAPSTIHARHYKICKHKTNRPLFFLFNR